MQCLQRFYTVRKSIRSSVCSSICQLLNQSFAFCVFDCLYLCNHITDLFFSNLDHDIPIVLTLAQTLKTCLGYAFMFYVEVCFYEAEAEALVGGILDPLKPIEIFSELIALTC